MRIVFLVLISIFSIFSSFAQHKGDYNWMFGYEYTDSLPGIEGTLINFNHSPPKVNYQPVYSDLQALGNSVSVMSQPDSGNLLFYSNGCAVYDASHNKMLNGDNINPGSFRDFYCDSQEFNWYPILGTLLSLEDRYNEDKYYFLHVPRQWSESGSPCCKQLMYSYIDMTKNDGLGEVVVKNEVYYDHTNEIQCASTSVITHSNGKDWWILHLENESNNFLKFLIDSTGINYVGFQKKNGNQHVKLGRATFSPDGSMLGIFNDRDGYFQYDFNRSTGLLSNPKHIQLQESNLGGGLSFSPSSEFVYLFYADKIYQLETEQEDLHNEAVLVDTLILFDTGQTSSFSHAQLGPDCKIYITHRGGVGYLGVINNPDEKGAACNLDQRGLDLAYFHDILSIPNFPPFCVDEEDKCDDTMTGLFPTVMHPRENYFNFYPNPVEDVIKVMPKIDGEFTIVDATGSTIRIGAFKEEIETVVRLAELEAGVYFINMILDGVVVQTEKLVKI